MSIKRILGMKSKEPVSSPIKECWPSNKRHGISSLPYPYPYPYPDPYPYYFQFSDTDTVKNTYANSLSTLTVSESSTYESVCNMCMQKIQSGNFTLSCNHAYHIQCLAKSHVSETCDKLCPVCDKKLDYAEISFIHTKYYNGTDHDIETIKSDIVDVQDRMNVLQCEYDALVEKKQQLDHEKEKSRKIIIYTSNNFSI